MQKISRFRRERGFSLVELSVATAIYSMGLGSLSLMMLLAVQGTTEARFETTAAVQLSSLAEMILITSDAAGHYAFTTPSGITDCDLGNACSTEEMALWQLGTWQGRLAAELPGGSGLVCRDRTADDGTTDDPSCDGAGSDVIKIFWQQQVDHDDPDSPPSRQVLRLP